MTLQTMSTRDALVAAVRKQILGGELRPGEPLVETALATAFGVARPTVRSALQELVARNLVQRSRGRSLIVPTLTEADVRDLFFVRTPLELAAVRQIVERRRPLEAPARRLAEMEALPADAGWADRVEAHTAFHLALVDAAGSARLSRIYPAVQEEMQLCLAQLRPSYPRPHDLTEEHRQLLDAVRSEDADHACAQMRAHLGHAVDRFTSQR
ncbi:GntR family transcriptional regulator [Amycolatopsis cihanbeyliensis]|uniref:GntR family transcriptional regulator n=1 Tax=Amycolatopsis cihanbeyliensis TaxID=1128664 RepID=A0A542CSA0_AMYCI|nr:GntR family transcriptional regulator [Amycolatopsis cihanbeyliensis]TQI93708.1 GntR family transcriptional regulator [Amycolatopsis cihanbeyliensis]